MAKTLLNAVNEILKRVGVIAGDAGELTTLTDSARQRPIDIAIQAVNEGIAELYRTSNTPLPNEQAESTITLADGDRDYALATDLEVMRWPLIDKTNNQYIHEYAGDYNDLLLFDPEQDDTGLPHWAVISPVNGELYLDRAPTSEEAGNVYTYQYDKYLSLSVLTDTVPFSDTSFEAMVPAWAEIWKREMRNQFDGEAFHESLGRALEYTSKKQNRTHWNPRARG